MVQEIRLQCCIGHIRFFAHPASCYSEKKCTCYDKRGENRKSVKVFVLYANPSFFKCVHFLYGPTICATGKKQFLIATGLVPYTCSEK